MKNTLKTLLIASAIILPASAYAAHDGSSKDTMNGKQGMMMQCQKDAKECPMNDKMNMMQSQMGGMMNDMQGMMQMMNDPAMKEKMQKMHEQMGGMMKNMQQMHEQMMQGGMVDGKTDAEKAPAADGNADHEKHHPKP